jgi:hypothetical protein
MLFGEALRRCAYPSPCAKNTISQLYMPPRFCPSRFADEGGGREMGLARPAAGLRRSHAKEAWEASVRHGMLWTKCSNRRIHRPAAPGFLPPNLHCGQIKELQGPASVLGPSLIYGAFSLPMHEFTYEIAST